MKTDESKFSQHVRDALHEMACAGVLRGYLQQPVGIIRAELLRLARENADLRSTIEKMEWEDGE
jgi:hypothetical protein